MIVLLCMKVIQNIVRNRIVILRTTGTVSYCHLKNMWVCDWLSYKTAIQQKQQLPQRWNDCGPPSISSLSLLPLHTLYKMGESLDVDRTLTSARALVAFRAKYGAFAGWAEARARAEATERSAKGQMLMLKERRRDYCRSWGRGQMRRRQVRAFRGGSL